MISRWILLLLLTILAPAGATGVQPVDECSTKLAGDRYYGAFQACLEGQIFRDVLIEKAIASDKPFHPLRHVTPNPDNAGAIRLFDKLVEDPQVRAKWQDTRENLKFLQNKRRGVNEKVDTARERTALLISPREILTLEKSEAVTAMTEIEGLGTVVAFIGNDQILRVKTLAGDLIHSAEVSKSEASGGWAISWHRDDKDDLWLYVGGNRYQNGVAGKTFFYRIEWKSKRLDEIPFGNFKNYILPQRLLSLGPKNLIVTTVNNNQSFNLATGQMIELNPLLLGTVQAGALDAHGTLIARQTKVTDEGTEIVYHSSQRTYRVTACTGVLLLRDVNDPKFLKDILIGEPAVQLNMTETREGRVLLAVVSQGKTAMRIRIFEPLLSDDPIFDEPLVSRRFDPALHWFHNTKGEPQLGMAGASRVLVADPAAKTLIDLTPIPDWGIRGWHSNSTQTYFWTRDKNGTHIYSMINGRGPASTAALLKTGWH